MQNSLCFYGLSVILSLICMVFPTGSQSIDQREASLGQIRQFILNQQWDAAESALLESLWENPSGQSGISAAELLARVNVVVHKAPMAMEWLEFALNHPEINDAHRQQIQGQLNILHQVYLPGQNYNLDRDFSITGVELEAPHDIAVSESGQIVLLDRYRLITLKKISGNRYQAIPPTTPLPEKTRTLEWTLDQPVLVTDYGFWKNHKMLYFQGAGDLTRIIDAVHTVENIWYVLDRRNADMLRFDSDGQFLGTISSPTPNGDERLLRHPFGGCWILTPSSRQIITSGQNPEMTIPFKGPGYSVLQPIDFATDWFGHLYVLNSNRTVTIFSSRGACLKTVHLDQVGESLKSPSAITIGSDGSMFITDRKKHNVFRYQ